MKAKAGDQVRKFAVNTLQGDLLVIPDPAQLYTHLQFRRFAGCPICNVHLQSFFRRRGLIASAGIREVIFFHSSEAELGKYQAHIASTVVADLEMKYYAQFEVGRSRMASKHPSAIWASLKGMFQGRLALKAENGTHGLPADILMDRSGRVVAVKYGEHANDQWNVAELIGLAGRALPT